MKTITKETTIQLALMLIYKVILEYSYCSYLIAFNSTIYEYDFSILRYINGAFVILALFIVITNTEQDACRFLLYLHYIIAIIPLTVLYEFSGKDVIAYNCMVFMFFLVAYIVLRVKPEGKQFLFMKKLPFYKMFYVATIIGIIVAIIIVLSYTTVKNGMPELTALDFRKIYTLVRSDYFITNKYVGYLFTIVMVVGIPLLYSFSFTNKRYIICLFLMGIVFILFLYSGNKTALFSIAVFVGISILYSIFRNDDAIIKTLYCLLSLVAVSWIVTGKYLPYSFLIRRVLLVPADMKFAHYEYFLNNEKIGIKGTILGKIVGINNYQNTGYLFPDDANHAIGRMLGFQNTNCNTGVLIEGYDKFGYFGFAIFLCLLIVMFLAIRKIENNNGHLETLLITTYFVYSLNDGYLMGSNELSFLVILILSIMLRTKSFRLDDRESTKKALTITKTKDSIKSIVEKGAFHTLLR